MTQEIIREIVRTPTKDDVGNVEKLSSIITGRILEMRSLKNLNYKDCSSPIT
jgi:hypothetical protein